ncbi:hypothetical protein AACH06_25860 [Ideonella sp. DXS29W]|uniref:Uncharacterized protein n=1 Tax=Ideonella lacteola TaxID=2984193 RepID=A0ABU9BWC2_9BURK
MKLNQIIHFLRKSLQAFKAPGVGHRLLATLVFFPMLWMVTGEWLLALLFQALSSWAALNFHRAMQEHLQARVDANSAEQWDVRVNGVRIGSMRDAQYAATMASAYASADTWIAQARSLAWAHVRVIAQAFSLAPLFIVWAIVLAILFKPTELAHGIAVFQQQLLDPTLPLVPVIVEIFRLLLLVTLLMLAIHPGNYGIKNHFAEAVDLGLRRWFSVPADGAVSVVPVAVQPHPRSA